MGRGRSAFGLIVVLALGVVALGAPRALAQVVPTPPASKDTTEQARAKAQAARAAYDVGRFEEAARLFEETYLLIQDPALLFNLGQSWRQAGEADRAIDAYRSYLRNAPPRDPARGQARRWLDELERDQPRTDGAPAPVEVPAGARLAAETPTQEAAPRASRWWLWTALGLVGAGVVAAVVLSQDRGADAPSTTLGTQRAFP